MATMGGQRRLSVRRGSVSASDPFGAHAAVNRSCSSSSSTLTIVRVVEQPAPISLNLADPPTTAHRRSIRRQPNSTTDRLSFAISSFTQSQSTPSSPTSTRLPPSPSSSPRLRPSSPSRRLSSSYSKQSLTPDQLLDLARQSTSPRYSPAVQPPSFTPLPADIYLPFIDRPAEVSTLLSTPPTLKLFSLLAQTFPKAPATDPVFSDDPSTWPFSTLRTWLTSVDRITADDALWVRNARRCVLAHSELIWERIKGALGVPPELELEEEEWDEMEEEEALDSPALGGVDAQDVSDSPTPGHPSASPLSIEPIVATPSSHPPALTPGSVNPPPLSLPSALTQTDSTPGLQDIGEEDEVEDDDAKDKDKAAKEQAEAEDKQVHGLRISTSPAPSSPTAHGSFSYPASPFVYDSGRNSVEPRSPEMSPSLTRRMSRTSSHGSVASLGRPVLGAYSYGGYASGSDFGDTDSERAYDPVGDRAPGNPLFPSNFARLAVGPTLSANNPALRTPRTLPAPAYPHPRFTRWAPGSRPPSWIEGWDPKKHEYAVTVASGSSVGAGGGE
ncbi:hypothetical protein BV22DRAFT_1050375 [Leucogyrophana mollusca]|uniref:Uncharacterized protein n=1 Tax=Leucogyrophana mollusca TaxID=85980 RepID=A0ACB8B3J3_9AGAM|nr:hypothetical protein BV22DRAFT_1050375 [Leucogyrophana mollusca]